MFQVLPWFVVSLLVCQENISLDFDSWVLWIMQSGVYKYVVDIIQLLKWKILD